MSGRVAKQIRRSAHKAGAEAALLIVEGAAKSVRRAELLRTFPWWLAPLWPLWRFLVWVVLKPDPDGPPPSRAPESRDAT